METYRASTFTLGTSTVITLPAKLNVASGIRTKVKKVKNGILITLDRTADAGAKIAARNLNLVEKLAGGIKISSNLTPAQMNKIYDRDIYGE